jgi:hypothetical protein
MSEQSGSMNSSWGEKIQNDFYPMNLEVDLLNQSGVNVSKNFNSGNNTGFTSFMNYDKDLSAVNNQKNSKDS